MGGAGRALRRAPAHRGPDARRPLPHGRVHVELARGPAGGRRDRAALAMGTVDGELPPEALGTAPGRGRLDGCRVLVVGAGTRPSDEPDPPAGNGRAIAVLAAREGAVVGCADVDGVAAEETVGWVRHEGGRAEALVADVADADACERLVAD